MDDLNGRRVVDDSTPPAKIGAVLAVVVTIRDREWTLSWEEARLLYHELEAVVGLE